MFDNNTISLFGPESDIIDISTKIRAMVLQHICQEFNYFIEIKKKFFRMLYMI